MIAPTIVTWKWAVPRGYRSVFTADTVNVLRRMVGRHYPALQRFVCVTDDPRGLDPAIEVVPLWADHASVPSPHGGHNPSCYRRLKAFAPEAAQWFGERFVSMDLDTVVTGDLTPIFERPEAFVVWGETNPRSWYNGSLWMLTAGARSQVWTTFNPRISPHEAKRAGRFGSDQGWMSHCLGPYEATWSRKDGVYSYRVHLVPHGGALPDDARLVMFHGKEDPWGAQAQRLPWVQEYYR